MSRMNILMILADQHNARLLGSADHDQVRTPNLDRLAGQGVRFANAYCQNPICTPSRVSILSGQYPHNHGYFGLSGPKPQHLPNLFGHCRRNGYRTAGFGKLHLPESPRNWVADDLDRFGDTYETADGVIGRSEYLSELDALGLRDREDSWHNFSDRYGPNTINHDARVSDMPYEHTQEMWCAREAMAFMGEACDNDQPFFVQLAFQKPHHPLLPVQQFWDIYDDDLDLPTGIDEEPSHRPPTFRDMWRQTREDKKWAYGKPGQSTADGLRRIWKGTLACVSQVDDVVGQLMRFLDEQGLAEKTIVIYSSDHGCYHGMFGLPEKAPGIGSDAICRVPMIWRVPGLNRAGTCEHLVESVDLAPTLASLCGLPTIDWADGCDITPLLAGQDQPVREAAFTENVLTKAVRFGPWRMTYYPQPLFEGQFEGELYNLQDDPDELNNLYDQPDYASIVTQGKNLILDWLTASQQVMTCQPAAYHGPSFGGKRTYPLAEDGHLPRPMNLSRKGISDIQRFYA